MFPRNNSVLSNCALNVVYNHQINFAITDSSAREYWSFFSFSSLFFQSFFFFPRGKITIQKLYVNYYTKQLNCSMTPERNSDPYKPHGH